MQYTHKEFLYTRDHRTPEEVRAGRREAVIGWVFVLGSTVVVLGGMLLIT